MKSEIKFYMRGNGDHLTSSFQAFYLYKNSENSTCTDSWIVFFCRASFLSVIKVVLLYCLDLIHLPPIFWVKRFQMQRLFFNLIDIEDRKKYAIYKWFSKGNGQSFVIFQCEMTVCWRRETFSWEWSEMKFMPQKISPYCSMIKCMTSRRRTQQCPALCILNIYEEIIINAKYLDHIMLTPYLDL